MMEKPINPHIPGVEVQQDSCDIELLEQLACLPKSIQPANDAWHRIVSRIENEQAGFSTSSGSGKPSWAGSSGRGWLALAASLLLVVISSVWVTTGREFQQPVNQPLAVFDEDNLFLNEQGVRVPAASIEREYQAAFKEFLAREFVQMPAAQLAGPEIQQDWELMQQLERELLIALEGEPGNPWLLQKLTQLRARQLQLLHVFADSGQLPGGNLI